VQNPTLSLEGDADATRWVLDAQDGPVVLVGHSYGVAVITEAGTHDQVAALVYIAAFAPDNGESVNTLLAGFPTDMPGPPILPPRDGFLLLDRDQFPGSFAADLPAEQATFMADAQIPWGVDALSGSISEPAWASQAQLVPDRDRGPDNPPPAQRAMSGRAGSTVVEAAGSHAIHVSQPAAVAALIEQAAAAAAAGVATAVGMCPSPWAACGADQCDHHPDRPAGLGVKVSDKELAAVPITRHAFHRDWSQRSTCSSTWYRRRSQLYPGQGGPGVPRCWL
jgi:Alpha/beta hydrolase family